jgi:ribosomal protein S15P/S13E
MAKSNSTSTGKTAAPARKVNVNHKRLTKALAGIERHLETHPKDGMSQQRVSTIKQQLSS